MFVIGMAGQRWECNFSFLLDVVLAFSKSFLLPLSPQIRIEFDAVTNRFRPNLREEGSSFIPSENVLLVRK